MFIYTLLALFLPSILASVLYSRDVIQKKPGQLGSEMHACNRMLDLPKPGACSHLSRLPALESGRREQGREAAGGEDFSLDEWYSENNER